MANPTLVFLGSADHPVLTTLYHYLQERGRCRAVYLSNELYPKEPTFFYQLGEDGESGRLLLPDGSQVDWDEVRALVLDGFFVAPPDLELFTPSDRDYLQTESWAALIAVSESLRRRTTVANALTQRDVVSSRLAALTHLASHGLRVPPVCVTSDPQAAREFIQEQGQVVFRPVSGKEAVFQPWSEECWSRLERLRLAPVHLEAQLEGPISQVRRLGPQMLVDGPPLEPGVLERLQLALNQLGILLGEATFFHTPEGPVCLDFQTFLGPGVLADSQQADLLATLLEEGKLEVAA